MVSSAYGSTHGHKGKLKKYTYGSISLSEDDNSLYDDEDDEMNMNGEYDYDTSITSPSSYVRIHNHPINKSHSILRNQHSYFYWIFGFLFIMTIFGIATFVKHETFLSISDSTQTLLYASISKTTTSIALPSSTPLQKMSSPSESTITTITDKPHIIYILADDLGWNSIGHKQFDLAFVTPTLSSLAKQGIVLDSYYAQEICTPARAALLTGRYPLTVGMQYGMVQAAIPWGLDFNETLLPEILRDNGYATHMLGKWHLGHYSPRLLPTARGFDTFFGYLNGETYYWSKRNPDHTQFTDIMNATTDCYTPYTGSDVETYSTFLYRDKAIDTIRNHAAKYSNTVETTTTSTTGDVVTTFTTTMSKSLFLYLAFQAVHDPFVDLDGAYDTGMPAEYAGYDIYNLVNTALVGEKRQQYALSLFVLDQAVDTIIKSLEKNNMLDNTLIIFSSDNGGCYSAGGKNGPLRGTKGTLFEGGVRVDSFVYSASSQIIPTTAQGTVYTSLFHISDWFPTILSLTNIDYVPKEGYELDSYNQWTSMTSSTADVAVEGPREVMLYNHYYNVDHYSFDLWVNGTFAVRNKQYKLMHTFDNEDYSSFYDPMMPLNDDDNLQEEARCCVSCGASGNFTYWLFDLINDPYETINIYDSTLPFHIEVKERLYALLETYDAKSYRVTFNFAPNVNCLNVWRDHDDSVVPSVLESDLISSPYYKEFPHDCSNYNVTNYNHLYTEYNQKQISIDQAINSTNSTTKEEVIILDEPVVAIVEEEPKNPIYQNSNGSSIPIIPSNNNNNNNITNNNNMINIPINTNNINNNIDNPL